MTGSTVGGWLVPGTVASRTRDACYMKFPKVKPVKFWNVMWVPSANAKVWLPLLIDEPAIAVAAEPGVKPTNVSKSDPDMKFWITTSV